MQLQFGATRFGNQLPQAQFPAQQAVNFSGNTQKTEKTDSVYFGNTTKNAETVLKSVFDSPEKPTDFSFILDNDNVNITFKHNGNQYTFVLDSDNKTAKVKVESSTDVQTYTYGELDNVPSDVEKLTKLFAPEAKAKYNLGDDLDCSNVLLDLADKTVNGGLEWKINQGGTDGSMAATLPDGTKYEVKVYSGFLSSSKYFSIQKPGLPPVQVAISNGAEESAFELLGKKLELDQKEQEIQEATKQVAQERQELKDKIAEAKAAAAE